MRRAARARRGATTKATLSASLNATFSASLRYYEAARKDSGDRRKFTVTDVKALVALMFMSRRHKPATFSDTWTTSELATYNFAKSVMSRDRGKTLFSSLRFTEDTIRRLEQRLCDNVLQVWIPGNVLTVDESMCPYKGRNNPHHIYIPRKVCGRVVGGCSWASNFASLTHAHPAPPQRHQELELLRHVGCGVPALDGASH